MAIKDRTMLLRHNALFINTNKFRLGGCDRPNPATKSI